jgi:hypothetical protein
VAGARSRRLCKDDEEGLEQKSRFQNFKKAQLTGEYERFDEEKEKAKFEKFVLSFRMLEFQMFVGLLPRYVQRFETITQGGGLYKHLSLKAP